MRTGSWVDVVRCFCSVATIRGGWGREAMSATATASTTNRMSRVAWVPGLSAPSSTVTATIGPNSPAAPAATRYLPNPVSSSPRSRSIGCSVPMAVVVRASPMSRLESTNPEMRRTEPTARPSARLIPHPTVPRTSGGPESSAKSIS